MSSYCYSYEASEISQILYKLGYLWDITGISLGYLWNIYSSIWNEERTKKGAKGGIVWWNGYEQQRFYGVGVCYRCNIVCNTGVLVKKLQQSDCCSFLICRNYFPIQNVIVLLLSPDIQCYIAFYI